MIGNRIKKVVLYISSIILISFFIPRLMPGTPLSIGESDIHVLNLQLPLETFNLFKEYYNPELSLVGQFKIYLKNLISLDLGYSFYYKLPVWDLICGRLPWTLILNLFSLFTALLISLNFAIKDSFRGKRNKKSFLVLLGVQAMPTFLVALLIQILFAYKLRLFPSSGGFSPGRESYTWAFFGDLLRYGFLPFLTMVICEIPSLYILIFNSTEKIKRSNSVKMAYYLNISEKEIMRKFIFPNILSELLGKINISLIMSIVGSLYIESVYSYPGIGSLLKTAISSRDYPLIQGILLFVCSYGILINFIFERERDEKI
jgi:peptide/nickel transport system permease protein